MVYQLCEMWHQRPDEILDNMTGAEIIEAVAYFTLQNKQREEAARQARTAERARNTPRKF